MLIILPLKIVIGLPYKMTYLKMTSCERIKTAILDLTKSGKITLNKCSVSIQFNGPRAFLFFAHVSKFFQPTEYSLTTLQLHLEDRINFGGHCIEMAGSGGRPELNLILK